MAHPLRLEHPGAVWHVTLRGNERRNIFRSDRDRLFFLDLLADLVDLHRWRQDAMKLYRPKAQHRLVLSSFDAILDAVEEVLGETRDSIRQRSHRPVRKAVAPLAREERRLTLRAIGEWLGLTVQAILHLIKRGRELEKTEQKLGDRAKKGTL